MEVVLDGGGSRIEKPRSPFGGLMKILALIAVTWGAVEQRCPGITARGWQAARTATAVSDLLGWNEGELNSEGGLAAVEEAIATMLAKGVELPAELTDGKGNVRGFELSESCKGGGLNLHSFSFMEVFTRWGLEVAITWALELLKRDLMMFEVSIKSGSVHCFCPDREMDMKAQKAIKNFLIRIAKMVKDAFAGRNFDLAKALMNDWRLLGQNGYRLSVAPEGKTKEILKDELKKQGVDLGVCRS